MIERLWWAPGVRPGSTHYKGPGHFFATRARSWKVFCLLTPGNIRVCCTELHPGQMIPSPYHGRGLV